MKLQQKALVNYFWQVDTHHHYPIERYRFVRGNGFAGRLLVLPVGVRRPRNAACPAMTLIPIFVPPRREDAIIVRRIRYIANEKKNAIEVTPA